MLSEKKGNHYFILLIALICFGIALFLHTKSSRPNFNISKQEAITNVNHNFLRFISVGNKRLISDILWIQTLMESDEVKYAGKNFENWMFLRFNSISELEPNFYQNYLFGGMYLSIVKDDLKGAAFIYEKGLILFPDDYSLNFNAGFNYYFEMNNFKKGLEKLSKVENSPRLPASMKFVIQKIKFEKSKDYDSTLVFLKHSISNTKDLILITKLKSDIYSLKAEKDLNCLNSKSLDCEHFDAENVPYVYRLGKWTSAKPFNQYRIHLKNR